MSQLYNEAFATANEKYIKMNKCDRVKEAVQYGLKKDLPENVMIAELTKIATYQMLNNPVKTIEKKSSKKRGYFAQEQDERLGKLNHEKQLITIHLENGQVKKRK
jgi:hypothetical protein